VASGASSPLLYSFLFFLDPSVNDEALGVLNHGTLGMLDSLRSDMLDLMSC
jgi:hypothetical protein